MAVKNTFDIVSQSISVEDFDELEVAIGQPLPASFKQHYPSFNGGSPFDSQVPEENAWEPLDVAMFLPIMYPSPVAPTFEMLKCYRTLCGSNVIPYSVLPFACDLGENYFALDLRDKTVLYYEPYLANPRFSTMENHTRAQRRVADSFKHFLDILEPVPHALWLRIVESE